MSLLGPNGLPVSSRPMNKKATPPKTGPAFGNWAGRDVVVETMPGGGVVQFDLSKLTLADYRSMRDHYQVNASLSVLGFMQHQSDWHLEGSTAKVRSLVEKQLKENWTMLNRTMGTANWSGYSPAVLEWENDIDGREVRLNKIKDLYPEECRVHWKEVKGWAPPGRVRPKFKEYDGIIQFGQHYPIPVENTYWYPLLMENGDYYGKKPLRPAFTSWFFSILVHLFANRYYERFGEPVPIGRAPFDDEIDTGGGRKSGNVYLLEILSQLRSRGAVVLPNDKTWNPNGTNADFDYQIEYLESQMRGADFERYLTRLDEEISIGLFTPILLMRTADVGSYNLGVGHMQVYLWMLNAMNDDRAQYIDRYLIRKMVNFNFSERTEAPVIKFRKMGNTNSELITELLKILVSADKAAIDLDEVGQMAGLTLKQVRQTTDPTAAPDPNNPDNPTGAPAKNETPAQAANRIANLMINRVDPQITNKYSPGHMMETSVGFGRKLEEALVDLGRPNAKSLTQSTLTLINGVVSEAATAGLEQEEFRAHVHKVIEVSLKNATGA